MRFYAFGRVLPWLSFQPYRNSILKTDILQSLTLHLPTVIGPMKDGLALALATGFIRCPAMPL
jgi:hypothetical protein